MSAASSSKSASASAAAAGAPAVEEKNECVKVVVRMRPFNSMERERGEACACDIDTATGSVRVRLDAGGDAGGSAADADGGGDMTKQFTFDRAYDDTSTQKAVFAETARPIVDSVIEGFNGTIFAYGQTGTGKTFTMEVRFDVFGRHCNAAICFPFVLSTLDRVESIRTLIVGHA